MTEPEHRTLNRLTTAHTAPSRTLVASLVVLILVATIGGLINQDVYRSVSPLQRETWRAQDAVNLALLPLLGWSWRAARTGGPGAHVGLTGLLTWLAYCYAHLAVGAPFTPLFLVHVGALALAGFGALDAVVRADVDAVEAVFADGPRRAAGWFLLISGVAVAGLWLSDIAVGVLGGEPSNLHLGGLPNPTWVLDLAFLIPLAMAAGIRLVRGRRGGVFLGGVVLVVLAALSVAMVAVLPFGLAAGLDADGVAGPQLIVFPVVFGLLAAVEGWLVASAVRHRDRAMAGAIRDTWWPRPDDGGGSSRGVRHRGVTLRGIPPHVVPPHGVPGAGGVPPRGDTGAGGVPLRGDTP